MREMSRTVCVWVSDVCCETIRKKMQKMVVGSIVENVRLGVGVLFVLGLNPVLAVILTNTTTTQHQRQWQWQQLTD